MWVSVMLVCCLNRVLVRCWVELLFDEVEFSGWVLVRWIMFFMFFVLKLGVYISMLGNVVSMVRGVKVVVVL